MCDLIRTWTKPRETTFINYILYQFLLRCGFQNMNEVKLTIMKYCIYFIHVDLLHLFLGLNPIRKQPQMLYRNFVLLSWRVSPSHTFCRCECRNISDFHTWNFPTRSLCLCVCVCECAPKGFSRSAFVLLPFRSSRRWHAFRIGFGRNRNGDGDGDEVLQCSWPTGCSGSEHNFCAIGSCKGICQILVSARPICAAWFKLLASQSAGVLNYILYRLVF